MHQGKKGNLILPLWFDSSNCSNDSSVVLWVLWMSPEPVILPVGTRGWGRMLLRPTKWPLNHRLWSHSGRWKSARLLLDVSGVWMRVYLVHPWQMCIVACVQGSGNWARVVQFVWQYITQWSANCMCTNMSNRRAWCINASFCLSPCRMVEVMTVSTTHLPLIIPSNIVCIHAV